VPEHIDLARARAWPILSINAKAKPAIDSKGNNRQRKRFFQDDSLEEWHGHFRYMYS